MTEPRPPWAAPFVLDTPDVPRERHGRWDFYDPRAGEPRPLVMFVHGGPVNPEWPATPRDWHGYRGYGAQVAARGCVAAVVDHRLSGLDAYPDAYADVLDAVGAARADERVDADRVAVWVFSGGGPFLAPLLRDRPAWLTALAATYPAVGFDGRELPAGFRPLDEVATAPDLPLFFTRVGLENERLVAGQAAFLAAAERSALRTTVIEVPHGTHGFDQNDHTDESRRAVAGALDAVCAALR